MIGGGSSPTSAQMAVEVETLKGFRDRVDSLLAGLDAGQGSVKSISAQVMGDGHLGSGFAEADGLAARYRETHVKLQQLSQTLSETIDAMSISIDCAQYGYQNVESTQIAELWKIHDAAAAAATPPASPVSQSNVASDSGGRRSGY